MARKIFLFFLCASFISLPLALEAQNKNVLLIIADDLNDWIEPYGGHPDTRTPNINKLAEKSIKFNTAWPTVSWCNPSRVSILTGIHPLKSGVTSNDQYPFRNHLPHAATMIDQFNELGYNTIGLGKILHLMDDEGEAWQHYESLNIKPRPSKVPAHGIDTILSVGNQTYDWAPISRPLNEWGEYQITEKAVDFLGKKGKTNPFFLAVGYRLPHLPYYYPQEFDDFLPEQITLPEIGLPPTVGSQPLFDVLKDSMVWESAVRSYLASIHFIDFNIGLLMQALEENNLFESTMIIFMSDHGYHIGSKGRWGKVTLWNEALRTPFFMYIPEYSELGGTTHSSPVSLLDIYPTISEVVGFTDNKFLDGQSLLPKLEGSADQTVFSLIPGERYAIHKDNFKYINTQRSEFLFDIVEDFDEVNHELINDDDHEIVLRDLQNLSSEVFRENLPYHTPSMPSDLTLRLEDGLIKLSWESQENVSYEVEIENRSGSIYRYEDSEVVLNEENSVQTTDFIRLRSVNPKEASSWTEKISLSEMIKTELDKLELDVLISLSSHEVVYNMLGQRLLSQNIIESDAPNLVEGLKEQLIIVSMEIFGVDYSRKVYYRAAK